MKRLFIIIGSGIGLMPAAFGQNLLNNGDFEDGPAPFCMASAHNDFIPGWYSNTQLIDDDESEFNGNAMHSPDLFQEGVSFSSCGYLPLNGGRPQPFGGPQSGNRCIGMATYELIQTEIPTALVPGKMYNLSMYIQLGYDVFGLNNNTVLSVSLARNKIDYKSQGDHCDRDACRPNYVDYENGLTQEIVNLKMFDLDTALYYSPDNALWKRVSVSFRWQEEWEGLNPMKWIALEVRQKNYSDPGVYDVNCFEEYLYIDNVVLQPATFCNSPCSPNLAPIEYSYKADYSEPYEFANALISNSAPWVFYVKNAIGIDFTVFNTWGWNTKVYEQSAFSPNGLKDFGYDDYQFFWNGDLPDGSSLAEDWYGIKVKIWSCDIGSEVDYTGAVFYLCCNGDNTMVPDIYNAELQDCCQPYQYYQNTTFSSSLRKDVSDFITAGANVTSGATGPVIVGPGTTVKFMADNEINLEPGFSVDPAADFEATLQSCLYSPRALGERPRENYQGVMTDKASVNVAQATQIRGLVNSKNQYVFNCEGFEAGKTFNLNIISVDGKQVLSRDAIGNGNIIDLDALQTGAYLIQVKDGYFSNTHKVIIVH